MPTTRHPRRREFRQANPAAELQAWRMTFECSYDYFSALADIGLDRDTVSDATIRDAWRRLGRMFLEQREPNPKGRQTPWAVERFGLP